MDCSLKKSSHCREVAGVERWPFVEVRLYKKDKLFLDFACPGSKLYVLIYCKIPKIILGAYIF